MSESITFIQVRRAIHVSDESFSLQNVFGAMSSDFMRPAQEAFEFTLNEIPVLVYDGNMDIICTHAGILKMFEKIETWEDIDNYYE